MIIFGIFITITFGYLVLRLINFEGKRIVVLALSYLIGLGLQTLAMFYMALLHIKLTTISVSIMLLSLSAVLLVLNIYIKKRPLLKKEYFSYIELIKQIKKWFIGLNTLDRFLLSVLVFLAFYALLLGFYWPVFGWDSIALYDFRARVFSQSGFMDDAIARGYFFGYPLLTSMAHTWVYLLGFNYPQWLYSLMYISFGVLFYDFIRKINSRTSSLIFTILLLTAQPIIANAAFAYTNLPFTVYFFLGTVFLYLSFIEKGNSHLILAAICMGLSTWTRSAEPFWVVNLGTIIIAAIVKKKYYLPIFYCLIFFPIQESWNLFQAHFVSSVGTAATVSQTAGAISRGIDLGKMLAVLWFINLNVVPTLLPYFVLMLVSLFIKQKKVPGLNYLILLIFGNSALLIFGAYIFSFIWSGWTQIGESLQRMIILFVPLYLFVAALKIDIVKLYKDFKTGNLFL